MLGTHGDLDNLHHGMNPKIRAISSKIAKSCIRSLNLFKVTETKFDGGGGGGGGD